MSTEPSNPINADEQPLELNSTDTEPNQRRLHCDRCGAVMFGDRCKIVCLNCGSRFDCSDLNLYFD